MVSSYIPYFSVKIASYVPELDAVLVFLFVRVKRRVRKHQSTRVE